MTAIDIPVANLPVRVVHLNSMLTGGGTDDQCVKLVRGLCQLQQKASLAGPEGREFTAIARATGVPFHPLPGLKLGFMLGAARLLRRERIQVVHGHHGRDLWPTVFAARLSGISPLVVLTRHMAKSPSAWVSRRLLLGQCDALIAVSHFVAKVLREGAYEPDAIEAERRARPPLMGDHSKVVVIYNGIDTGRFQPGSAQEQRQAWGLAADHFAFGVVGGYDLPRGKGQREFLQAAARVHGQIPNARFIIVGRGNMRELLQKDIAALGLAGKAWLTPYASDMVAAMNALDCLVHPQVGTEAFAGVLLEAFACGKPVIASSLDGIPEAFAAGDFGQLIPPESVPELAQAMAKWAQKSPLTDAGKNALHAKIQANFSLDAPARKVLELYRRHLSP